MNKIPTKLEENMPTMAKKILNGPDPTTDAAS